MREKDRKVEISFRVGWQRIALSEGVALKGKWELCFLSNTAPGTLFDSLTYRREKHYVIGRAQAMISP